MRLYDTYSRSLVELPSPPGPVRMYFCGPTVYARAHVGNARPFIIGMWLRSWLARAGTKRCSSTTSPTSTTRSTTRRRARAPSSPSARPGGISRTPAISASACPTTCRRRPSRSPRSSRSSRSSSAAASPIRCRATSTSASRASRSTAGSPASAPTRSRSRSRTRSRRTARLRALEGEQAGTRTRGGSRRGAAAGRAGTSSARRWPRRSSGRRSRSTAAGSISSSRITRTRWRSPRARSSVRPDLGAQRDAALHRREDVEVARQRRDAAGRARRVGARDAAAVLSRRSLAQAGRLLGRHAGPGRSTARDLAERVHAGARGAAGSGSGSGIAAALDDDFDTPRALARAARMGFNRPVGAVGARFDAASASAPRGARSGAARGGRSSPSGAQRRASTGFCDLGRAARRVGGARLGDARRAGRRPCARPPAP